MQRLISYFSSLLLVVGLGSSAQAQDQAHKKRQVPDGTVRFETGSTRITETSKLALDRIAEYIAGQAAGDILVVGHTDLHGGRRTNLRLSKRRAQTVKRELGKRSVPGSRITVMGVGASEPLSIEKGKVADNLNRRVEVWVGTREAIAWVSYIYRTVQSQKPAAKQWDPAEIRQRLRRLFRVRTLGQSAGEVTFSEGRTLYLGPEALVVIYGKDTRKRRGKRTVADVTVEQGSLLASLGPDRVLVDTQDARFKLMSNRTRIDASPKKARTTVSVYDGTAEVSAQRKTVKVPKGFGTRVRHGQAPEAATALPLPPRWTARGSVVGFARRPVTVSWTREGAHPGAFVELGSIDDRAFAHPMEMRSVETPQVVFQNLPPGAYLVRVSSVDVRDIIGVAGAPRTLIILPSPEAVDGHLTWNGEGWTLSEAGRVRLPKAGNVETTWVSDLSPDAPMPEVFVAEPGPTNLKVQLSDEAGRLLGEGRTQVVVKPISVRLVEIESSRPAAEGDEVTFIVEATNSEGLPENGLVLGASLVDVAVMERSDAGTGWMLPLGRVQTATGTYTSMGEGRYRIQWTTDGTVGSAAQYVLVYDLARKIGQNLLLPVVGPLRPPRNDALGQPRLRVRQGLHLGVAAGAERARDAFHPGFRAQIGWTVIAEDRLRLSMSIESGLTRAEVPAGTIDMVPLFARATVGISVGRLRPYVGFAGGMRFLDAPDISATLDAPKAAMEGILGIGAYFSGLEAFIEGRYGPTKTAEAPGFGAVGEPGVYGGLRYYLQGG